MLSLASTNPAMLHSTEPATSRLKIGGISIRRSPSPAFKLKIETNLDADGNCAALQQVEASGLWNDPVVASQRIPREEVQVNQLIGQGAFGQVFSGSFRGDTVAVKKLRPETQQDDDHVDGFLAEVKVSAALNHPHIVRFVGVAWTSVSDLCVVQEFMEGGDLRSLLDKYEAERHAIGFDRQKTHIAMQICSALVYMHSLSPPVIHSNLKSRNVLLSGALEAKVTNFGTSPKRTFKTSTQSKNATLWMAPEVICGEMHSTDADMFSFGVVLSELDMLSAPYAQARQQIRDASWRPLQDADILQKVTKGSLRVVFSESGPMALAELGRACVSVNPLERPTASEALYRLQTILAQELA